jgi:hypothetical protein
MLSARRIEILEEMGFKWSLTRGKKNCCSWDERVAQLKIYKERFGDCNVPKGWEDDVSLGDWVEKTREVRKDKGLIVVA